MRRWLGAVLITFAYGAPAAAQPIEGEKAREAWQRVPDLIATLNIGPGSSVADVGAGYGFLTVRLAPIVGAGGRVFAVDASASPLEQLRHRMADEHLENVTVVEGDQHDPHLPAAALDAVAILNAYHEFTFVDEMLQHLRQALKPGGRLVTLEPVPRPSEQTPEQQKAAHVISPERVVDELQRAGFTIVRRDDRFVKHPDTGGSYALVVSERPRAPQAGAPDAFKPYLSWSARKRGRSTP